MKKTALSIVLLLACMFLMIGCGQEEATVVNTYEKTSLSHIEEYTESGKDVTTITYYELSDGSWKTDEYTYQYKLELTGSAGTTGKNITYIVLSNSNDITFERARKASGISSDINDYFNAQDAVIVATRFE